MYKNSIQMKLTGEIMQKTAGNNDESSTPTQKLTCCVINVYTTPTIPSGNSVEGQLKTGKYLAKSVSLVTG